MNRPHYAKPPRGSRRFRFSLADAMDAAGHACVLCLSVVPVAFKAAEEKVLPTAFATGLTMLAAFTARSLASFVSDTRR